MPNDDADDSGEERLHLDEFVSLDAKVTKLTKEGAKTAYSKAEMLDGGFEILERGPKGEGLAKWAQGIDNAD